MNPSVATWREAIEDYIREQARPVDKFGHQPRLYALTREIGEGTTYDDDVVYAAAWMHDLGVFVGHRPEDAAVLAAWDNVAYAVEKTPEVLAGFGFPPEKVPAVLDAIRTHQPRAEPRSIEATILRDADILEQLGAMGILRAVCKVGRDTRYSRFSAILPTLRTALETLPPLLRLPSAKALAEPRMQVLRDFLDAAEAEAGQNLY